MVYEVWPLFAELCDFAELSLMERYYAEASLDDRAALVSTFVPLLTAAVESGDVTTVFDTLGAIGLIDEHGRTFFDAVLNGGPAGRTSAGQRPTSSPGGRTGSTMPPVG
jgi:hypothetical protein